MQSKSQNVGMKIGTVFLAGVLLTGAVNAQSSPQPRRGTAESSLVGVTLYDVALRVVNLYGSPDEIQGINFGGTGATGGPGTGSGPAGGGGGAQGGRPNNGGARGGGARGGAQFVRIRHQFMIVLEK